MIAPIYLLQRQCTSRASLYPTFLAGDPRVDQSLLLRRIGPRAVLCTGESLVRIESAAWTDDYQAIRALDWRWPWARIVLRRDSIHLLAVGCLTILQLQRMARDISTKGIVKKTGKLRFR